MKLIGLSLLLGLISSGLKGQSVSTIGEIYDYEINDVFEIKETGSNGFSGFLEYSSILISGKYYSANSDTVFYIRSVNTYYSGTNNPEGSYNFFVDTISYTNLSSLLGNMDSVYYSADYNGRKVNLSTPPIFDSWVIETSYIEGCGGPYDDTNWYGDDEGFITSHWLGLTYFKKGLDEWGTIYYFPTSIEKLNSKLNFRVYPNPTSNILLLDLTDQNFSSCYGTIYSSTGKRIEELMFSKTEKKQLDISTLNKGLYIIRLNIDGDFYSATFVKN
ncbi:T9SS type A sorting domain-containing protein [Cryomorpha ignava]|uniref:T9SS type A sorting domain-containing protein n=1 Tax=Cryomorpha ignava TaxID=101383 RepID=A0A7K3WNS9_9FLAO|nr:T9SS type A sorting domain-containing protein [Cryomorpha ignava]NEN23313.1 T9SS type A sorting domain-containing protein [Cryomorpha ignava]